MQIVGLSQCFNRKKMEKLRMKREGLNITISITKGYEHRSNLAYLRPTLSLVVFTRIMRGAL